jgi:hypothetical protein
MGAGGYERGRAGAVITTAGAAAGRTGTNETNQAQGAIEGRWAGANECTTTNGHKSTTGKDR